MSDSARHSLFAIAEVDYGVTPTTPAFDTIRHTGVTLGLSKSTLISAELRADRQIADYRHGTKQIGGDISTELSYGSFDTLLEAVLLGTWAVKAVAVTRTTISAAAGDNSINDAGIPQVETATVVGAVTGDGNASVTVTAAGLAGSPLLTSVAVLNGDSVSTTGGKIRAALGGVAAITALFAVGGAGANVTLTRLIGAANDSTLNIAIANDTSTGLTAAPTSANTTAGVASALPLVAAGDKITIAGFTGTTANNQNVTVVSRTAAKIVVSGGVALVNDAAGEAVTITTRTQVLKAGVTRRSFSVMRNFSDLDAGALPFHLFTGVEFNKLALKLSVNQIVTAVFSALGQAMAVDGTAPTSSTYVAPTTTSPLDSFTGQLLENGSPIAVLTELTMTLENGLEARFVVGSDETIRPSIGRSNLSAQTTAYFEDATLLNKFINETESSIVVNLPDLAGNAYRMTLPRIKYNGGQPDTQGQGAITLAMPIQALYDAVTGTNIIIERNPV